MHTVPEDDYLRVLMYSISADWSKNANLILANVSLLHYQTVECVDQLPFLCTNRIN